MKNFLRLSVILLLTALPGCGDSRDGGPSASSSSTGGDGDKVVVDGSSTVFRISKAAQLGFAKDARGREIDVLVGNHGTGGGFGRYLQGEVDIVDASRAAKPEEESEAKQKGLDWTRFLVGYDGITVVVHPQNPFVKVLTVDQLKRLFEPGSRVKTWKALDPSWPDRPINLYAPDNDSGTYEFFSEAIVQGQDKSQRSDVQASPDDNTLVTGVSGDVDALGYFGYAYYAANAGKLRAVPIQNGPDASPVAPNLEAILSKQYAPLSRPLYLYVKNASLKRPAVAQFLRYYLDNIESLTKSAGYVPPTAEDRAANDAAFAGATGK